MVELFKSSPGAFAFFMPVRDGAGRVQPSLAKIASYAKSCAVGAKKACITETLILMEQNKEGDLAAPIRLLKVTITEPGERSARSLRYISAQKPQTAERRREKVKAYAVSLDGQGVLMVGARSAIEAAKRLGSTPYILKARNFSVGAADQSIAVEAPGKIFRQNAQGQWEPLAADQ